MLTLFHDELPGVLSEQVVEGDENHRVRVDGLLADAPLQAVPVQRKVNREQSDQRPMLLNFWLP